MDSVPRHPVLRMPRRHTVSLADRLMLIAVPAILGFWLFVLGTCIGSFLNVVIYRLPAGIPLGSPKSRCPGCLTPLAARDNIPVLGWLLLRGRCRYCRMPIAGRYPLVEFSVGLIFAALALPEIAWRLSNIPVVSVTAGSEGAWLSDHVRSVHPFGMWLYHCCLMTLLTAIAMMARDGTWPQSRLSIFGLTVAVMSAAAWPGLLPISWSAPFRTALEDWYTGTTLMLPEPYQHLRLAIGIGASGIVSSLVGAAAGVITGLVAGLFDEARKDRSALVHQLMLTGAFTGRQFILMAAPLVLAVALLTAAGRKVKAGEESVSASESDVTPGTTPLLVTALVLGCLLLWRPLFMLFSRLTP